MNAEAKLKEIDRLWDDAYRAFLGAFDSPIMRRRINNENAEDARRRLRELARLIESKD